MYNEVVMTTIKSDLPDAGALSVRIRERLSQHHTAILAATGDERATVKDMRFRMLALLVILMASGGLLAEATAPLYSPSLYIFLGGLVAALFVGRDWFRAERALARKLNLALLPILNEVFSCQFTWDDATHYGEETKTLFRESGLVTERVDTITVDDLYRCSTKYPLTFRELLATRQESDGKNSRTVTVFHGVLVTVLLPKTLMATTYVSTEGVKHGLAHKNFWSGVKERGIEETVLEWNDFEKDLHVASSDGTEARYILTPDFMADLYAWWQEGKENIRISFSGNQMLLLLPDRHVRVNFSTTATSPEKLSQYLMSIAKPIWRTLTLVEDVRL